MTRSNVYGGFTAAPVDEGCWRSLIPMKFHKSSGLSAHQFTVLIRRWNVRLDDAQRTGKLEVRVACNDKLQIVMVERGREPDVFAAILLISSVDGETVREKRYLTLFSAYESLVSKRDVDASAIRHALAHPPHALRDPKMVRSLKQRFGGLHINLRDYSHQKEFYRCMGTVLCAMDRAIATRLCASVGA